MSSDFCIKCDQSLSVYCDQCYDRVIDRAKQEEMALRQKLSRMEDAFKTINFWLDEFAVQGEATPDAISHASRMQGDVLRQRLGSVREDVEHLKKLVKLAEQELFEVNRHAEEQENRADRLQAEVEELREWQLKVAEGTGYINHAEGQGGYDIAAAETIVAAWKRRDQ